MSRKRAKKGRIVVKETKGLSSKVLVKLRREHKKAEKKFYETGEALDAFDKIAPVLEEE